MKIYKIILLLKYEVSKSETMDENTEQLKINLYGIKNVNAFSASCACFGVLIKVRVLTFVRNIYITVIKISH